MDNSLLNSKNFQDKVFLKIRESLGDLLTEDELKPLVSTAIEKAFFEPVKVESYGYGSKTELKPSWLVQEISKILEIKVKEQVELWIQENPDKIKEVIQNVIDKGIVGAVSRHFDSKLWSAMNTFQETLNNR